MGCCGGGDGSNKIHPKNKGALSSTPQMGGPRHCTDLIWLVIFLVFWAGMAAIAYLALTQGTPIKFLRGTDSFGNVCGKDNSGNAVIESDNAGLDLSNRSHVFYYSPTNSDALILCVSSCPTSSTNLTNSEYCVSTAPYSADSRDLNRASDPDFGLDSDGCPTLTVGTYKSILHRCVPTDAAEKISSYFGSSKGAEILSQVVDDFQTGWREMIYLILVGCGISLLMILFMGYFSFIIIWTSYILAFVTCLGAIGYMWYTYREERDKFYEIPTDERLQSDKDNISFYYHASIVVSIVAGIILLILLVLRKRLALLIALFKEAGHAVLAMPSMLLTPFFTFAFVLAGCVYFVGVYIYLYSITDYTENAIGHADSTRDKTLQYMQWYHIFGFIWLVQFLFAVQQFTIAGAVAKWYFRDKRTGVSFPVLSSFKNAFRYHLGSLAFGAFIIALVKFARLILAYIQSKLKGRTGAVVDLILKCCQCCLWLLEKVLKFINKNAYIEIAIYGYSFCKATREAFSTLVRNALRVATINSVGTFVLFLSKLVVVAVVAFAALYWFNRTLDLGYPAVLVATVCIATWIVATIFTSVYNLVIDALFLCFAEDSQRNDGSLEKPLHASSNLMQFMDKSKRQMQKKTNAAKKNADSSNGEVTDFDA